MAPGFSSGRRRLTVTPTRVLGHSWDTCLVMLYLPHHVCRDDIKLHLDQPRSQACAPTYIDYVMTWVQNMLDGDNVFPTKSGQDSPPSFPSTVKHIYRQLLRVFAHIYHAHYAQILHLRSEPHFNSLFAHFLAFGSEFELLEMKDLRGSSSAPVGVGALSERWKGMGILGG